MKRIVLESYWLLLRAELLLCRGELRAVGELVHGAGTSAVGIWSGNELCRAMDLACVFYPKRVLCLQRAAATALLLRRHGQPAEVVIGVQTLPFKSHAWVEVDSAVVNDRPDIRETFRELERW